MFQHWSVRARIVLVTILNVIVLVTVVSVVYAQRERASIVQAERELSNTLILSVNNTIVAVSDFVTSITDISGLNARLMELGEQSQSVDFIAVTTPGGLVLASSEPTQVAQRLQALDDLPPERTVRANVAPFGNQLLTSARFDEPGEAGTRLEDYQIVVGVAVGPILAQQRESALFSLALAAISAVVTSAILLVILQRTVIGPIEALEKTARRIEAGDLSVRASVERDDEIGHLAASFNQMTERLSQSINTLEERVRERTADLEAAREEAERANRAKSEFLSNMSHELRTPLNMVIGYSSSMLSRPRMYDNVPLPQVYQQDIRTIQESGKYLLTLINDVLDLSKVEAGKLELHFGEMDLMQMFAGLIATSVGLVKEKPVQIRPQYPDFLPLVWGDPVRVRQILLNLLSNAIKFTDTGSVTLFAEVRGAQVYIAVRDTGRGIAPEALDVIFDRFAQIQNDVSIEGTGLGLDISQRLAELHGTRIEIESTPGVGSTFSFTLPIAPQHTETFEFSALQGPDEDNVLLFETSEEEEVAVVLLIERNAERRRAIREMLADQPLMVVDAQDADQGFEVALSLAPQCIVLNVHLEPGLLDRLRAEPETASIPRLLLLAPEQDAPPTDPMEWVLTLPLDPHAIRQALRQVRERVISASATASDAQS